MDTMTRRQYRQTLTRRQLRLERKVATDPWASDRDVQKHDAHERWAQR